MNSMGQPPPNTADAIPSSPSPKHPIAPFPRDSAAAVWALAFFRQRLFSHLGRKDRVSALVISRGSFGEACRAMYFDLDLERYRRRKPEVVDPVRLSTYRQAVRVIHCIKRCRDLRDPARLSDLLATYPYAKEVSDEDGSLTLKRAGREISEVELSTALSMDASTLAGWTNTAAFGLPTLWSVKRTYRLTITTAAATNDHKSAFTHRQKAWKDRLGIFKEHITELRVEFPVKIYAFARCYASARSIGDGHSPPSAVSIQVDYYTPSELSQLGAACSGFLRELSISPSSRRSFLGAYPDDKFFQTVDWDSFRGIRRLSICVSDELSTGGSVLTIDIPTSVRHTAIAPASFSLPSFTNDWTFRPLRYPHLSLNYFCLSVHHAISDRDQDKTRGAWPVPSANEGLIPSQIAKAMLAVGGPTCEYQVRAATPSYMNKEYVTMFDDLMTNLVRREICILLNSDLDPDRKIGWRKGGRDVARSAEHA